MMRVHYYLLNRYGEVLEQSFDQKAIEALHGSYTRSDPDQAEGLHINQSTTICLCLTRCPQSDADP